MMVDEFVTFYGMLYNLADDPSQHQPTPPKIATFLDGVELLQLSSDQASSLNSPITSDEISKNTDVVSLGRTPPTCRNRRGSETRPAAVTPTWPAHTLPSTHAAHVVTTPHLFATPVYPVYIKGEAVTLECYVPPKKIYKHFEFYKNFVWIPSNNTFTYHIPSLDYSHAGTFTCEYWDGSYSSPRSNAVLVIILDAHPPPPTLYVRDAQSVYVRGQSITMVCSLPQNSTLVKRIQYVKDKIEIESKETDKKRGRFLISKFTPEDAGEYICAYWVEILGREVSSVHSNTVLIEMEGEEAEHDHDEKLVALLDRCSTLVKRIQYVKDKIEIESKETDKKRGRFLISKFTPEDAGEYICAYWVEILGREVSSVHSNTVLIEMEEHPESPTLYVHGQQSEYVRGQSITLVCSVPYIRRIVKGFRYFKDGNEVTHKIPNTETLYVISMVTQEDAGEYNCDYTIEKSGREILSFRSNTVIIKLSEHPESPTLYVYGQQSEYVRGQSITLVCSVPYIRQIVKGFRYFKDGNEVTHKIPNTETLYVISRVTQEDAGEYNCDYTVEKSGREILSFPSNTVIIKLSENNNTYKHPNISAVK
ncbi:immunoglobulin superfamily member 1-like [Pelobates cultripes]|nr:immunoglobulin superfamily member 1-like [Pelobates cultripes]